MRRYTLYILLLFFVSLNVHSQTLDNNKFEEANAEYNIGHFDTAYKILTENLEEFHGDQRIVVYRLLALCCLNMDEQNKAEEYASNILSIDPYYTLYNDNPRLIDILISLKAGKTATITTASQQVETIEEAPVPVTVISEEMIHNIGARTLKEALIAYVPGMTDVSNNEETNLAFRGVYSSGQEKILIMINGHRLNSYSTNNASPDFSISLDKVKQIEVLRGPASSLYGGVALTGVVNIILKEGRDVDGINLKGGIGNFGQYKGSLLFGNRYMNIDVLAWGSLYTATGEAFKAEDADATIYKGTPGNVYVNGFNSTPTYDIGASISWKGFNLLYNRKFSKMRAQYSLFSTPYDYHAYTKFNATRPGYATEEDHAEVSYSNHNKSWGWKARLTFDHQNQQRYQIAKDEVTEEEYEALKYLFDLHPNGTAPDVFVPTIVGVFQNHVFSESTLGAGVSGTYNYAFGKHSGNILFGGDFYYFSLDDSYYAEGDEYGRIIKVYDSSKNLETGTERSADAYVQLRHKWKHLIINTGLRYDYKSRHKSIFAFDNDIDGYSMNVFSPRISLIWMQPKWNIKLGYAKSFVDAPYFYRFSSLDTTTGYGLGPEYLQSFQLTGVLNDMIPGMRAEANIYYNNVTDFVQKSDLFYTNAGMLKTLGAELSVSYKAKRFLANTNLSWMHVMKAKDYQVHGSMVYNIPEVTANIGLGYKILSNLNVHTNINIASKHTWALTAYDEEWTPYVQPVDVPARAFVNLGASYDYRWLGLSANIYNLFGTKCVQGGTSDIPMFLPGRWFMIEASIRF